MCEIKDGDVFDNTFENRQLVARHIVNTIIGNESKDCCIEKILQFTGLYEILKKHTKISEDQKLFTYNYFIKGKQECAKKLNY